VYADGRFGRTGRIMHKRQRKQYVTIAYLTGYTENKQPRSFISLFIKGPKFVNPYGMKGKSQRKDSEIHILKHNITNSFTNSVHYL